MRKDSWFRGTLLGVLTLALLLGAAPSAFADEDPPRQSPPERSVSEDEIRLGDLLKPLKTLQRVVAKSILPDPFGYSGDAADCVASCGVEVDACMASCDADDAACRRSCMAAFGSCKEGCRNSGYSPTCRYVSIGRIVVLDCTP